jgi:hypothetical protein
MLWDIFKLYGRGKFVYNRILKPVYLELRKDAYAEDTEPVKEKTKKKTKRKNAVNQKSKRSHQRQANS